MAEYAELVKKLRNKYRAYVATDNEKPGRLFRDAADAIESLLVEMPKRCCDCKMYVEDIYCCHLLHREIENPWADDGVELDCPLIPVPDHGRLIDGDVLRTDWLENGENEYVYDTNSFLDSIDSAPTIIPADKEGEG